MTEENKYQVYCYLKGIKKRCRKIERHQIKLGYYPLDVNVDELKQIAKNLMQENFKSFDKQAVLNLNYVTIKENMVSFMLYDAKNLSYKFEV